MLAAAAVLLVCCAHHKGPPPRDLGPAVVIVQVAQCGSYHVVVHEDGVVEGNRRASTESLWTRVGADVVARVRVFNGRRFKRAPDWAIHADGNWNLACVGIDTPEPSVSVMRPDGWWYECRGDGTVADIHSILSMLGVDDWSRANRQVDCL